MVYPVLHLIGLSISFNTTNRIHMIKKLSLLLIFFRKTSKSRFRGWTKMEKLNTEIGHIY